MSAEKVIAMAKSQVGYLEKASNYNLDSMSGNAGYNNWTKYARDLNNAGYYNGNKNGYAWCDVFVDWCFFKVYGSKAKAEAVQCQTGTLGAGCEYSMCYYKAQGRFDKTPKPGDQIFFYDSAGDIGHTGLVYAVTDSTVYTIEGNTSSASGVVANGGGVAMKSYSRSYSRIAGYGHPRYDVAAAETAEAATPTSTGDSTPTPKKTPKYFYPYRKYQNGSTEEIVYKDTDFKTKTGSLNPWESCYCVGRYGGAYLVLYLLDGTDDTWATGYVKYNGGITD